MFFLLNILGVFLYIRSIDFVLICKHLPAFCHLSVECVYDTFLLTLQDFKNTFSGSQLHHLFMIFDFPHLKTTNVFVYNFLTYISHIKMSNPSDIILL